MALFGPDQADDKDPLFYRGKTPVLGAPVEIRTTGQLPTEFPATGAGRSAPAAPTPPTFPGAPKPPTAPAELTPPEFPGFPEFGGGFEFPPQSTPPGALPDLGTAPTGPSGGPAWWQRILGLLGPATSAAKALNALRKPTPDSPWTGLWEGPTTLTTGTDVPSPFGSADQTFNLYGQGGSPPWAQDAAQRAQLGFDSELLTPAQTLALESASSPWTPLVEGTAPGIPGEWATPTVAPFESGAAAAGAGAEGGAGGLPSGAGGLLGPATSALGAAALGAIQGGLQGGTAGAGKGAVIGTASAALPIVIGSAFGGPWGAAAGAALAGILQGAKALGFGKPEDLPNFPTGWHQINIGGSDPKRAQWGAVDPNSGAIMIYGGHGQYDWSAPTKAGVRATPDQMREWGVAPSGDLLKLPGYADVAGAVTAQGLETGQQGPPTPEQQQLPAVQAAMPQIDAALAQRALQQLQNPREGQVGDPRTMATAAAQQFGEPAVQTAEAEEAAMPDFARGT